MSVSIPFIAGQWSLQPSVSRMRRRGTPVSIPFIAGQWSLLTSIRPSSIIYVEFQSPSLRGSGRFDEERFSRALPALSFNPLHCGAVVASSSACATPWRMNPSFNPLHCGAVVASFSRCVDAVLNALVSIPFIAGQWSLLVGIIYADLGKVPRVSIPFISGQWSLLPPFPSWLSGISPFQSPSLRGSGRFGHRHRRGVRPPDTFQSPSLRGSGRFLGADPEMRFTPQGFNPLHCGAVVASRDCGAGGADRRRVSIPFIAGQWSLLPSFSLWIARSISAFQSPSLRGSGRFACTPCCRPSWPPSFNPLHCGAVVASPSHNALLIVRRPAAEEATSVRPHHLHALAVLT